MQLLRVGFALGGFHRLADEEAEQLVFARAVLRQLLRIGGDDVVDDLFDGAAVGDLSMHYAIWPRLYSPATAPYGGGELRYVLR